MRSFWPLLLLSACARVNLPEPPPPILEITVWFNQQVSSQFFYFIAIEVDDDPTDGPFPEVSGDNRARNWMHYILYTGSFAAGLSQPDFFYHRINPPNDAEQIWLEPFTSPLSIQPFFLTAEIRDQPVEIDGESQPRFRNALFIELNLPAFLGNANRMDITFLTATRGVDNLTNPPEPPEIGAVIDSWSGRDYFSIPSLAPGIEWISTRDFPAEEDVGDVPRGYEGADLVGWSLRVR